MVESCYDWGSPKAWKKREKMDGIYQGREMHSTTWPAVPTEEIQEWSSSLDIFISIAFSYSFKSYFRKDS